MTEMVALGPGFKGPVTVSSEALGKGGEGSVFSVVSHSVSELPPAQSLVAKIYHEPTEGDRKPKVATMVKERPDSSSLAWPYAVLTDSSGMFKGYLMTKLDGKKFQPWYEVAHTSSRRKKAPDFSVQYALYAARNFAETLQSVHQAGHAVGDVNESNIFVGSDASVMLVDTDSAQIKASNGRVFPCLVGKPEYTAPELSHGSLKDQTRTEASDVFAFAVSLFQILTGGAHPADGVYLGAGDPPSAVDKIRRGIYPGLRHNMRDLFRPVDRVATAGIPSLVRKILVLSLSVEPSSRPPFAVIVKKLDEVLDNLVQCPREKNHFFDRRDRKCGWCEHANTQPDPWSKEAPKVPSPSAAPKTLPNVNFNENTAAEPTKAPRRKVSTSSSRQGFSSGSGGGSGTYRGTPMGYSSHSGGSTGGQGGSTYPSTSSHGQGGYSGGHQPPPQQQPPAPEPQSPPRKYRGKTVLMINGQPEVRPSLSSLFRTNPRLAFYSIGTEWPSPLRVWWDEDRKKPGLLTLLFGPIAGLFGLWAWAPIIQKVTMEYSHISLLREYFPLVMNFGTLTALLALASLFIFGLVRIVKGIRYGGPKEMPIFTLIHFFIVGFSYMLLPVVLAIVLVVMILKFLISEMSRGR